MKKISIYVHIPFCKHKCNYCAFYSKIGAAQERKSYVDALVNEISTAETVPVETIYFGGGTPSIFNIAELKKIFDALREKFTFDRSAEVTVEVNPGTVTENYLRSLRKLGFNRISIGVQSLSDEILKTLGRIHDSQTAIGTIHLAGKYFDNISVDLMFGLPGQSFEELKFTTEFLAAEKIQHISVYGLEIEEGTNFFARKDSLNLPSEEAVSDMYDFINAELPRLGFARYEISSFARQGFESRHNVGYWIGREYLGFGAAAHSYKNNLRTANISDVATYIKNSGKNISRVEEVVTTQAAMEEFCFLGLRMTAGISRENFFAMFGEDIFDVYGEVLKKYFALNLLQTDGDKIFLTRRGLKVSNAILADFLL